MLYNRIYEHLIKFSKKNRVLYFRIFINVDARDLSPPLTFCCIIEYTPYYFNKLRCRSMLRSLLSGCIPEWTKPSTLWLWWNWKYSFQLNHTETIIYWNTEIFIKMCFSRRCHCWVDIRIMNHNLWLFGRLRMAPCILETYIGNYVVWKHHLRLETKNVYWKHT